MNIRELESLNVYKAAEQPNPHPLGLSAYTEADLKTWKSWLRTRDLSGITILTLHSVGNDSTPVRWLASIIQPIRLAETLKEAGITSPSRWKTMAPVNMNAWVNSLDSETPIQHAGDLHALARGYMNLIHPGVIQPELEIDNEDWAKVVSRYGKELFHQLPDFVKADLENMAAKHRNGLAQETEGGASYLLSHFNAYGHLEMRHGFPPRTDTLIILPASENRFFTMMDQVSETIQGLGMGKITPLSERNCVVLVSDIIRTPHYYPHSGEPTLEAIVKEKIPRWPTRKMIFEGKINGWAKQEVAQGLALIDQDLGGIQHPKYSRRLAKVLTLTRETLIGR